MESINIISYYYNLVVTYFTFFSTYLYDHFREFALVIKIAAVATTISCGIIVFCLLRLAYKSWNRRRWNRIKKRLNDRYGEGINYILSEEAKPNMTREEIYEALDLKKNDFDGVHVNLKNNKEKMTMCRLLYEARISENAVLGRQKNLHVVLNIFKLRDFLEELVNKGSMKNKAEALHMLRAFKIHINQWIANQLMMAKRNRVRRLAMYASIMSSSNSDLEYFETEFFDNNCCIYDEIQLGYVLSRRRAAKRKIPNLAHWAFIQKNPETQCIFVRLMRQFEQKEYCNELEELFQHDTDKKLIDEIARTWGYLRYEECEESLCDMILTQSDDTKVTMMHAITRIGSGKRLDTLVEGFTNNGNPHVKFEALRCMYNYGEAGKAKVWELEAKAKDADKSLFAFFHNDITLRQLQLSKTDRYASEYGDNIYSV